jgi:DNA-directed RNA polymerase specialized sigma24 family protein
MSCRRSSCRSFTLRSSSTRRLLARLPLELAEVVVYYYVDEMTHDEIAEQIGCSRRQIGNLLARAADVWRRQERKR